MKMICVASLALALLGCSQTDNGVRISAEKPAPPPAPVQKARNEPIFYNGKTYQLRMVPTAGGIYDMSVAGMSAGQQKDAVAVATSSLRYFACPDGKTGKLTNQPRYAEASWKMSARCG
jgi:hypothetical protein